jgi:hypothetical protein
MTVSVEKSRRRKLNITASDERIEAAARRMRKPLERWMRKAGRIMVENEIRRRKKLQKSAAQDRALEAELLKILVTFGLRSVDAAGKDMHDRLIARPDPEIGPTRWKVPPSAVQQITQQKKVRVTGIVKETRDRIRRQVREIMLQAQSERPRPSISEIARRIRTQIGELKGLKGEENKVAIAHRAELIARTESAQSENTGIVEGMAVAGVDGIEWLAHTDGRSGDRHHERMNGKKISLADSRGSDRSKWFLTPLGNRLRYPADPSGPIEDTARCRCTVVPVIRPRRRKK